MKAPNERLVASLADRYTIERELGQGGMATVYLANDVRHDRRVALKVMRPELSAVIGAERFLAEIKTTAGLQHPHILPLHDSGEADGTVFYVMPFVEGESLRDRLKREKQMPVEEAVRVAREVASALDYAHRHGVVHRDIKPENILLHDGQALVADFGIALAVSRSDSNTRMTETGMSLGTPHYMAPEQAMGEREITQKADIYALGAVLYEMLTGDPPFTGSTAQAIVARAVTESPRPITIQRHTVPQHVEAAVLTALEKLPADRFATAGEFAAALDNPSLSRRAPAHVAVASAVTARRDLRARLAVPLGVVAALAAGGLVWSFTRSEPAPAVRRYAITFPVEEAPQPTRVFAVSSTGSHFLYVGPGEGQNVQLWLKPSDRERATPLPGTVGVQRAIFSPNGDWVAFVQGTALKKLPIAGGGAIQLADSAAATRGLAWLESGEIIFVSGGGRLGRELRKVPEGGGATTAIWQSDSLSAWNPTALPGDRGMVVTLCLGGGGCPREYDAWLLGVNGGEPRRLVPGAVSTVYVPTGHLVYVRRDGAMLAVPFNLGRGEVTGSPQPLRDGVALGLNDVPLMAVSKTGTLFVRTGGNLAATEVHELVWVDRQGRESVIDSTFRFRLTVQGENRGWALSQDGRRLAIGLNTDAGDNVWVKQLPNGPHSRISFDSAAEHRPRWLPDGKGISFVRYDGTGRLFRRSADGLGSDSLIADFSVGGFGVFEGVWSGDGNWLVIRLGGTMSVSGGRDIFALRIGQDSVPRKLIASDAFDEAAIALSPDGRWLAYESNETGRTEVYFRPFPNVDGGKWQVSADGGRAPLWARNSREIFYVNAAREMIVKSVTPGPTPDLGPPRRLFQMRSELYLADLERYTPFDISPDGLRFIMARRVAANAGSVAPISVTENWFEELKRIVGGR